MNYAHVTAGIVDIGPRPLPRAWRNVSGLNFMSDLELKGHDWFPVRIVNETYDHDTQVRTGPVLSVGVDEVIETYTVRSKTAQELADADRSLAVGDIHAGIILLTKLVLSIIKVLISKGVLTRSDFTSTEIARYDTIKALVDRT